MKSIECSCSLYCIYGAIRGPDLYFHSTSSLEYLYANALKQLITRRVRAIVFDEDECLGGYWDQPIDEADIKSVESAISHIGGNLIHWLDHLADAVYATRTHPIWGGYGRDLSRLLVTQSRVARESVKPKD